ncbi:Protein of unknown function [Pyronema omphalodes CBS 100304]|uniref:Uncharacterized protein n=1 Tax=Pyronema omphalodes (strain CBS 100304) TaxID=1076935 RepID=U4LPW5_PYROM|nr:Protein of unknown function [Pyronema omphalodes CBS 100304]
MHAFALFFNAIIRSDFEICPTDTYDTHTIARRFQILRIVFVYTSVELPLSIVAEIKASDHLVRPLNVVNLVGRCLNLLYRRLSIGVIRY